MLDVGEDLLAVVRLGSSLAIGIEAPTSFVFPRLGDLIFFLVEAGNEFSRELGAFGARQGHGDGFDVVRQCGPR